MLCPSLDNWYQKVKYNIKLNKTKHFMLSACHKELYSRQPTYSVILEHALIKIRYIYIALSDLVQSCMSKHKVSSHYKTKGKRQYVRT